MIDIVANAWEKRTSLTMSHIDLSGHLISKENLLNYYKKFIIDKINFDFRNKTVIDYGIGGGYLGLLLFSEFGIDKYIGYDIAKRSLKAAANTLAEYENKELILVKDLPIFEKADLFISMACFQHFPTEIYTNLFLKSLNNSQIKNIYIQYRYGKHTVFRNNYYTTIESIRLANCMQEDYIKKGLSNYKVIKSEIYDTENNLAYIYLEQK